MILHSSGYQAEMKIDRGGLSHLSSSLIHHGSHQMATVVPDEAGGLCAMFVTVHYSSLMGSALECPAECNPDHRIKTRNLEYIRNRSSLLVITAWGKPQRSALLLFACLKTYI